MCHNCRHPEPFVQSHSIAADESEGEIVVDLDLEGYLYDVDDQHDGTIVVQFWKRDDENDERRESEALAEAEARAERALEEGKW